MITVLHQHQREVQSTKYKVQGIESEANHSKFKTQNSKLIATKQDCQLAKDLLFECIMLKMDELDGSLRQFFERLKEYVKKQNTNNYEFTQREIREALKVKKTQLSYYLNELQHLEYVQQTSSHINKGNKYRILYFDDYQKVRAEVKYYLQEQIDKLEE
jgi:DNA-binding transcriptional regulator GbsR (MarR family)